MAYDRYEKFRQNGKILIVPFIQIPKFDSDYYEVYKQGQTRLDNLSYQYYNDPNYDWLIMLANPEYGSMEYSIPDGATLRIPHPLSSALSAYIDGIDTYNHLYK